MTNYIHQAIDTCGRLTWDGKERLVVDVDEEIGKIINELLYRLKLIPTIDFDHHLHITLGHLTDGVKMAVGCWGCIG